MTNKTKLMGLIHECEHILETEREFYTDGCIHAAEKIISRAKAVLDGSYSVPFIRNREFYTPREDDDILHITEYYSRTPSYGMTRYGVKPMLEWLKENHAKNRIKELEEYASRFTEIADKMPTGGSLGSFDKAIIEAALEAINRTSGKHGDDYAKSLVNAANAIRKCYATKKLLCDIDKNSSIFMPSCKKQSFIKRLNNDDMFKENFARIKDASQIYTSKQTAMLADFMKTDIDYKKLNEHFYIWSTTDKVITFRAPENARFASLQFILPKEENENDGLGHIWIDNIRVCAGQAADWKIENNGFEIGGEYPELWEPIILSGSPVLRRETTYPYCGSENASAYIENAAPSDEGGWRYRDMIEIEGGSENTIIFNAKIDGKFKKGIKILIEFFDSNTSPCGEFTHYFNRKSVAAETPFALTMQADAIMYYVTGDVTYAKKSKEQFIYVLNDFCQGMETWFAYNLRPDGCDAYGAVQGGRIMCSLMSAYSLIKDADIFTEDEWQFVLNALEYMASYLFDDRPRIERTPYDVQSDAGNWQTDMACGMGVMLMTLPKTEHTAYALENVNYFLKSQLLQNVGADGSWPESMRYHMATLMRFAIYAKILKNCTGEDWFRDPPLLKMFRYPALVQTPAYEYKGGKIGTPNFGDHLIKGGDDFSVFGLYYRDIYNIDKPLGRLVYKTWIDAGAPKHKLSSENIIMENFLSSHRPINGCNCEQLTSTGEFRDIGTYIMRSGDNYCAVTAPQKYIGHGHYDAGSIIIYKNNIPVIIDPGIEGYFDSTKDWYVSSSAHSVVQFARKDGKKLNPDPFDICLEKTDYSAIHGWNDVPRSVDFAEFNSNENEDTLTVKIRNPEDNGIHIRRLALDKNDGVYYINDTVENYDGLFRHSLVTAMQSIDIKGNTAYCKGYDGVYMEIKFLTPVESISVEDGRTADTLPDGKKTAKIIRVTAKNKVSAIIHPHER